MASVRVYGLACVAMLMAGLAMATTIVMPTDDQLIEKSPVIVRGTVIASAPVARGEAIWTETLLAVDERIKGDTPDRIIIREIGGVLGDRITKVFGAPEFTPGERVLLFVTPVPDGRYQTMDLFVGKFSREQRTDGRAIWTRSQSDPHVDLLSSDLEPIAAQEIDRDAERFERFVRDRVAGRLSERDYLLPAAVRSGLRTEANFSLIDEPNVYRWFAFDSGAAVSWRSSGSQPGYSGGGLSDVRTAMAAWTGYSEARILYQYDGTFSTAPGGLDRTNGINEVLLNDPLDEIPGSFNAATGGVVGRGGFNGVSASRNWTSPFQADSTHQGSYRAWNITEGNLVIQDGVSPGAGISSSRFAEIVAHEFGHTLGFGHSADATALMYASVTGRGPSLRSDDQLAARWLYPNGTAAPPPPPLTAPAAPTGLSAAPTGNSVALQWNDNATNESGQSIYYAAGSGSFSKAADVAAGARSVTLTGFTDGSWRFYVTAYNAAGESAASNVVTVTVSTAPPPPLVASFTWSPAAPVADGPVLFTDTSTGGVTSRRWNFGDGTSSTQETPVKRYSTPGTYTVTLTVYRGGESRVAVKSIAIAAQVPATPPVEPYRSLIPVSAQSEGVAGSVWRTELTLFNAGGEGVTVNLVFVPQEGGAVQSRSVFVSPRESLAYANALRDLFGLSSGSGAIAVDATGATATPQLKITSRTFNDAIGGTYGLAVPDVQAEDLRQTLYLTGMATTAEYRTNIGLVNRSDAPVAATLTLFGSNGTTVATANVTIAAESFRQEALHALFPAVEGRTLSGMSMRIQASTASALSAYASVVDNRTHDPLYIAAVAPPARQEVLVPIVGRGAGAHGTFWRSDVSIFNPESNWLAAKLWYGGRSKSLFVGPRQTVVIADVVADLGFESGTGTLVVTWDGSSGPVVTTRNYTPAPGGGTFGQSIDPVASLGSEIYVAGLRSDHAFRANVGFVNGGTSPISVQATIFSASGAELGTATLQLSPDQVVQTSIAALFPGASGSFTLRASSPGAALFAYGSVIDNASGDPVFIAGR